MSQKQKMIDYAVGIAKDDSHGYSQVRRWPEEGTDFDCASLMYEAADHAGYKVKRGWPRYTGSMLADFKAAGFTAVPFDGNLSDLEPGDILLNTVNHTEMYIGNGQFVGAHIAETGDVDGKPGDQTGNEISVCNAYIPSFGWNYVLVPPSESQSETQKTSTSTQTPSSGKKQLNGIDIASWQAGINIAKVDADFVIIKVSGGTDYVNPYWRDWANATLKAGKLLGLYHYACEYESEPGGKAEAEFFLKQIEGFEGKAILCLDWEAHATSVRVSYAKTWLDTVAKATGSTPLFYSYASYLNSTNLSSIANYPLWVASYPYKYENGSGYVSNPDMITDTGNWKSATIYQYSSTRIIKGYGSRLDVNVFYGSVDDWKALCGGSQPTPPTPTKEPVIYRSSVDKSGKKWLGTYKNLSGDGHSGQYGTPIRWLAIDNVKRYRVFTVNNGWLPWVTDYNVKDLEDGCAGDGSPILGVQIDDDSVKYGVHVIGGGWYSYMIGLTDTGGSGDNFAGDLANKIDAFRALRV